MNYYIYIFNYSNERQEVIKPYGVLEKEEYDVPVSFILKLIANLYTTTRESSLMINI